MRSGGAASLLKILPLSPLLLAGACVSLRVAPHVPDVNVGGMRYAGKVAVVIPDATRKLTKTDNVPSECVVMNHVTAQPYGSTFEETVSGVLGQYFDNVVIVDDPPPPADARLVLEASLERVAMKWHCGLSTSSYAVAQGNLRVLGPDGKERWRASRTSSRCDEASPTWRLNYSIIPGAIASLAAGWAAELAATPFVRGAGGLPESGARQPPPAESAPASAEIPAPQGPEAAAPLEPAKVRTPDFGGDSPMVP